MEKLRNTDWIRYATMAALLVVLTLVAGACSTADPTNTPEPTIPQVSIDVSEDGLVVPNEMSSGIVAVTVTNNGQTPHGPMLARLREGVTMEQFQETFSQSPDDVVPLVSLLGGTNVAPGESQEMLYEFAPGDHVVVDFGAGAPGEAPPTLAAFSVSEEREGAKVEAPVSDVNVDLHDFAFAMPVEIPSGSHTWKIENQGEQWHEMAILKLADGATVDDVLAMMASEDPPQGPPPFEEVAFLAPVSEGEKAWITLDLEPGVYSVLCFLPDLGSESMTSHLEHGMMHTLTVTES